MMNDWGSSGGMGLGFLFMLLFWGLVIVGIVALFRWPMVHKSPKGKPHGKSPLEILQERYARGEIEQDEYEQKKRDLEA
ncbi:MAG: electron transporter RnfE [Gallionellales bacterium RIFCSPLOWO2_12_FULL_59_22]|nr:MAG: electron transporter RnfE [Gallionellales bacterium RIFCSPLOWO2_12_FULL_59_22]